ncbi:carboxypeptidase-like regulatory domain-containing protein, partial [Galbibacter sp.]|uniref:carboxypeptidase-like regulatory domain-containing protein n=1 Tax=Galbibacter sp. TaxID=2918471 RepID=UPI002B8F82F4
MQKPYLPYRNSIWVLRFDLKTTLSLLLLITAGFIMQAKEAYSQRDKVSLDMKDVRVGDVLNYIESTTDYKFFFNTKTIDLDRTVSLKVSKLPIEKVMELLFDSRKTRVIIKDRTIILKQNQPTSSQETLQLTPLSKVQQEIGGNVTDASGIPLVGANIIEKGTNNGVTADFDGNFSIAISNQTAILVVSYLGFDSKEVTVNAGETITVVLEESAAALDEVVVVGYGTQKKVNITGAITSINTEEINEVPTSNLSNTLAGRAPGVNITNTSGLAGASSSIRIRGGFGDPL